MDRDNSCTRSRLSLHPEATECTKVDRVAFDNVKETPALDPLWSLPSPDNLDRDRKKGADSQHKGHDSKTTLHAGILRSARNNQQISSSSPHRGPNPATASPIMKLAGLPLLLLMLHV